MNKMKRFLFSTALFLCSLLTFAQYSGSGSGTDSDPYLVFNENQLSQISNFLKKDGVVFKLMKDLDLSAWIAENNPSQGWLPLGVESSPFKGKFLGNNHTLSGIVINRASANNVGFFGYLSGATISNLTIEVTSIDGATNVGGIAGYITNSTISDCHVILNETDDFNGKSHVGGIAGYSVKGTFSDVIVSGTITNVGDYTGGITGYSDGCDFTNTTYEGSLFGKQYVGGIAGALVNNGSSFNYCFSKGEIIASGDYCGGIVGVSEGGQVKNISSCSYFGNIKGQSYVGGLIGAINNTVSPPELYNWNTTNEYYHTINGYCDKIVSGSLQERFVANCTAIGTVTGISFVGGLVGKETSADTYKTISTYETPIISSSYSWYYYKNGERYYTRTSTVNYYTYERNKINLKLNHCYYSGIVEGKDNVGGLYGYKSGGSISQNYTNANVYGQTNVGGIVGCVSSDKVSNSGNYTTIKSNVAINPTISATSSDIGRIYGTADDSKYTTVGELGTTEGNLALTLTQVLISGVVQEVTDDLKNGTSIGPSLLRLKATYVAKGWNFDTNWNILETESYPYKKFQAAPPIIESDVVSQSTSISGNSIDGGTIYMLYKDKNAVSTQCVNNQWTFNTEPLQSGAQIQVYAEKEGMVPSYFTSVTVGYPGSGTEKDPWRIYSSEDLQGVSKSGYYKVMNDIDLTAWISENSPVTGWPAIGRNSGETTYIDGGGHKVTGLWINTTEDYNGLFSNFSAGHIKNLNVEVASGKKVKGGDYTGILVGHIANGIIENCSVKGTSEGKNNVGGVVGRIESATIKSVTFNGKVNSTSSNAYLGGVAGQIIDCTAETCRSTATINASGTNSRIGGFVGYAKGGTISKSLATATINTTGANNYVGGLVGYSEVPITLSVSKGRVASTGTDSYVGGLVGYANSSVSNCYSTAIASGTQYTSGLVGYTFDKIDMCYASGDVSGVKYGAGVVGELEGSKAELTNSVACNNILDFTDQSSWACRVIGGYKNGASDPDYSNYALSTMQVTLNNVPQKKTDDLVEGIAKTEAELMSSETYLDMGWDMTETWSIDEGVAYPYLQWEQEKEVVPVTEVKFDKTSMCITIGETGTITASVLPLEATKKHLEWSTSDSSIAIVENGVVTAISEGTAIITAKATDGTNVSATCEVTVKAAENDSDCTNLLVNPGFSDGSTGWTIGSGNSPTFSYGVVEVYNGEVDIYQIVNDVPAGVYSISVQAFERPTWNGLYDGTEEPQVFLYMNDFETPVQNIVTDALPKDQAVDGENCYPSDDYLYTTGYVPNGMYGASIAFAAGRYNQKCYGIVGDDGIMKIGLTSHGVVPHWVVWNDFKLTYEGKSAEAIASALTGPISNVQNYYDNHSEDMSTVAATALQDAIAKAKQTIEEIEEEEYETIYAVLEALNAAKAAAQANIEAYAAAKIAECFAAGAFNVSDSEEVREAARAVLFKNIHDMTTAELEAHTVELNYIKAALKVPADANTASDKNPVDMTVLMDNPDFWEDNFTEYPLEGWSYTKNEGGNGPIYDNGYDGPGFEFWNSTATGLVFDLYQTIYVLPAGKYTLAADLANSYNGEIPGENGGRGILYADVIVGNDTTSYSVAVEPQTEDCTDLWDNYQVTFDVPANAKVIVGTKSHGTMDARWYMGDSFTLTYYGNITNGITGITLDVTSKSITTGDCFKLIATVVPEDAADKNVTWSSSDTSVATVDTDGNVTAVGEGTAIITAKAGEYSATCEVVVQKKVVLVSGVTLSQNVATMNVGEILTLTAATTPEDATDKNVTWSSSDANVATVDQDGKVTAISSGEAIITVVSSDGGNLSARCVVTVVAEEEEEEDQPMDYANMVYFEDATVFVNTTLNLPLQLKNENDITAVQFDVYLPEGVTIEKNSRGKYNITFNEDRADNSTHTLSSNLQADGAVRVICYSTESELFWGNEGAIFNFPLEVSDMEEGEYSIIIKKIIITEQSGKKHEIASMTSTLNVLAVALGDCNRDNAVDVADIVTLANHILNNPVEVFVEKAADFNKDNAVDVADIVAIANFILGGNTSAAHALTREVLLSRATSTDYSFDILPFVLAAEGTKTISLDLADPTESFTAFQCDLYLPEGISIDTNNRGKYKFSFNEERTDASYHALSGSLQTDGSVRILCYSTDSEVFFGTDGALINIPLTADATLKSGVYEFSIANTVLTYVDGRKVEPELYRGSIIVGDGGEIESMKLYGKYTAGVLKKFTSALSANESVTSVDLTDAVSVAESGMLTTGNPNTLIYLAENAALANANNVVCGEDCSNLKLTDGYAFAAQTEFVALQASYTRELAAGKYGTITLPFAPENEYYIFYELTSVGNNTLTFEEVNNPQANTPYLYSLRDGKSATAIIGTGAMVSSELVTVETDGWQTVGSFAYQTLQTNDEGYYAYAATDNQFHRVTKTLSVKPFRAYMKGDMDGGVVLKVRTRNGNETLIDASEVEDMLPKVYYDLSGRRVEYPTKGVYVVNGKKVVL